jgi:hypothetical protein
MIEADRAFELPLPQPRLLSRRTRLVAQRVSLYTRRDEHNRRNVVMPLQKEYFSIRGQPQLEPYYADEKRASDTRLEFSRGMKSFEGADHDQVKGSLQRGR